MIIEIAGADIHFIGDMVGRNTRRPIFIEKLQTGLQNALAGLHA
jgi:hypothetical protein